MNTVQNIPLHIFGDNFGSITKMLANLQLVLLDSIKIYKQGVNLRESVILASIFRNSLVH